MYNSINNSEFAHQTQDSLTSQIELAARTVEVLEPYIHHVHWGRNKCHMITKAELVAFTEWQRQKNAGISKPRVAIVEQNGKPWRNYETGKPIVFNYFRNFKLKLFRPPVWKEGEELGNSFYHRRIMDSINGIEVHYFMSRSGLGRKLLYLDADAHELWQTDLPLAKQFSQELFGSTAFYRWSKKNSEGVLQGFNGWLKLCNAPRATEYNNTLKELEVLLGDMFAQRGLLTNIETKGQSPNVNKIETFDDTRAHLAKLPHWNYYDTSDRADKNDVWNKLRCEEFASTPDVPWEVLVSQMVKWRAALDPAKVAEGKQRIDNASGKARTINIEPVKREKNKSELDQSSATRPRAVMLSPMATDMCRKPAAKIHNRNDYLDRIRGIADARERQHKFAMWFCRKHNRVVSIEELLDAVRQNDMYRGAWNDGELNRRRRCEDILGFVSESFDAEKCGSSSTRCVLNQHLRGQKAKIWKLPSVICGNVGRVESRIGQKDEFSDRQVMCVFLAIVATVSKPDTGDCPRDSIQGWWQELAEEGLAPEWNVDRYTRTKHAAKKLGLIKCNDSVYVWTPFGKGQCKRMWLSDQPPEHLRTESFAAMARPRFEAEFRLKTSYPPHPSFAMHNGYDADVIQIWKMRAPWESVRRPP